MGKKLKLKEIKCSRILSCGWNGSAKPVTWHRPLLSGLTSNRKMVAKCVEKAVGVDIIDVSIFDSLFIAASNLQRYCRELGHMGLRGGGHVLVLCAVAQASRLAGWKIQATLRGARHA
jgi:hypothetical protein